MRRLCAGLAALCLVGCVHTNVTELGERRYEPTNPEAVVIYRTSASVKRPFEEIGLIKAGGSSGWTSEKGMSRAMRKQAAKIGAHAIILGEFIEPSSGSKIAGAIFGVSPERKGDAVAIRFRSLTADERVKYTPEKEESRTTSGSWN